MGQDFYESKDFIIGLRLAMVVLNVYYFFIRRMLLFPCLVNVWETLKGKMGPFTWQEMTPEKVRLVVELFVTMLLIGVNCLPGGHH